MNVGSGIIEGGWGFIWAAYGLTWAFLVGYGLSLVLRHRASPPPPVPKE